MTEGVTVTDGNGTHQTLAVDPCTVYTVSTLVPQCKVGYGGQGSYTDVSASNPLPVTISSKSLSAQTTLQNAATANGNGTAISVAGYDLATLQITASVAMSGGTTINFEVSTDNSTWVAIQGEQPGAASAATSTTSTGDWQFNVAGYSYLRARISAYSAGTITVIGFAEMGGGMPIVSARLADGSGGAINSTSGSLNVDVTNTPSVTLGAAIPAGTNLIGAVNLDLAGSAVSTANPVPVTLTVPTISASTTLQNAATANGNGTAMNVAGYETAALQVTASVAMSGGTTINFEVSEDNSTWVAIEGFAPGSSTAAGTTTTATGDFQFNVAAYSYLRARISAYSAGTITITGFAVATAGAPAFLKALVCDGSGNAISSVAGALGVSATLQSGANSIGSVAVPANSTGGATPYHLVAAGTSSDKTSVKTTSGTVYLISVGNIMSTACYFKLFDKSSAPTMGTDTPKLTFLVPGNTAGAGTNIPIPTQGIAFSNGIAFAITGGIGDTDSTSVTANDVVVDLAYA